jgi:hypothetical protein
MLLTGFGLGSPWSLSGRLCSLRELISGTLVHLIFEVPPRLISGVFLLPVTGSGCALRVYWRPANPCCSDDRAALLPRSRDVLLVVVGPSSTPRAVLIWGRESGKVGVGGHPYLLSCWSTARPASYREKSCACPFTVICSRTATFLLLYEGHFRDVL